MAIARRRVILAAGVTALGAGAGLLGGCSSTSEKAGPVSIDVVMKGGKLTPGGDRVTISRGSEVTVTVTSDVDLLVHVHGYDKELHSGPGKDAKVTFPADMVGSFEIEAHDPARIIALMVVK